MATYCRGRNYKPYKTPRKPLQVSDIHVRRYTTVMVGFAISVAWFAYKIYIG